MTDGNVAASPAPSGPPMGQASTVAAPRRMWWIYLLVTFALAGMGGGAQALFDIHDLGRVAVTHRCLAEHGLASLNLRIDVSDGAAEQFRACTAAFNHRHSLVILVGAGLVLAVAWLLMLCGGLSVRWQLRRSHTDLTSTTATRAAASRFEAWCDAWKLTGRGRPQLLLAAPGALTGQAFTTGFPLARPLVVVPLSYAYTDPALFDVVVLHELAHVRARDLLWTSVVWWAGWLSLPVLLLALSPIVGRPRLLRLPLLATYSSSLGLAVALSAAVLVLRAALLRRRELAADRYAVEVMGDTGALRAALGQDPDHTGLGPAGPDVGAPAAGLPSRLGHRIARYLRQLTASHPAPAARAHADSASLDRWEGGFAVTAATGLLAMCAFQSLYVMLPFLPGFTWADPRAPADLAFAAAGLLWAGVPPPPGPGGWRRPAGADPRLRGGGLWPGRCWV